MKILNLFFTLSLLLIMSCGSQKDAVNSDKLYDTTWQLEYMSGVRIAFDGLFPNKKPK